MTSSSLVSKFGAELFGTFWLVFGGCGSAIFAAKQIAQAEDGSGTAVLPFEDSIQVVDSQLHTVTIIDGRDEVTVGVGQEFGVLVYPLLAAEIRTELR